MNKMKFLAISAASLALAGVASAQVKITGSTAFRKATYNAIIGILDNPRGAAPGISGTTADISGAARAVITGTIKAGKPGAGTTVSFQTAFGGSTGGIEMITKGLTAVPGVSFTASSTWTSTTNSLGALSVTSSGVITGALAATVFDAPSAPNATMADSFQSSTPFKTPVLSEEATSAAAGGVGILEFYWVKGIKHPDIPDASYQAFNTITNLQAQLLLANGSLPLSFFTGEATDIDYEVALVGRNDDSGTRLVTHAESGYGFGQGQSAYKGNTTTGNITGMSFDAVGQSSGGTVASYLNRPITAGSTSVNGVPWIFVGYLGKADSYTATGITTGSNIFRASDDLTKANALKWNGQTNNAADNKHLTEGVYTFWAAQHVLYLPSLTGSPKNALDAMTNEIRNVSVAFAGVKMSDMKVSRSVEGGVVSP